MNRRDVILLAGCTLAGCSRPVRAVGTQVRPYLYQCEGCEAVGERAPASLTSSFRIAPDSEPGEPLVLTGRVLEPNGLVPAAGVVIYAHHTDSTGRYSRGVPGTEWSMRHGLLRGWVKTDRDGRYMFRTIKPAPYPDRNMPAHIHLFIGEPGRRPYYIDDVVFAGEFGVTRDYLARQELRGGSGVVGLERDATGTLIARRNVVLERHPR